MLADGDNPNALSLAFDNTNILGVTSTSAADAATATTGIEAFAIGYTGNVSDKTEWGVAYWDYSAAEAFVGTRPTSRS